MIVSHTIALHCRAAFDIQTTVIVPEGVTAGQTIAVMAPDGSRLVRATIPAGLKCGDTFLVRLATAIHPDMLNSQPVQPASTISPPNFASALDNWTTPVDQNPAESTPIIEKRTPIEKSATIERTAVPEKPVQSQPTFVEALDRWLTPLPEALHHHSDSNSIAEPMISSAQERDAPPSTPTETDVLPNLQETQKLVPIQDEIPSAPVMLPSPSEVQQVSGQPVNANVERAEPRFDATTESTKVDFQSNSSPSDQKLLLVHVPPGMPAGATMQVEIPGENRTLAAQIPPGAQSFHIAYTPRLSVVRSPTASTAMATPPLQAASTLVPQQKHHSKSPKGHKLLLVRVPPGTLAGTTLHVSVPDEPGRILAAQVPPGNVQEFHVSYEARPKQTTRGDGVGMLPPASPYNHHLQQQPYYDGLPQQHQQVPQQGYHHPNGNHYYPPQQQPRMMANNNDNNGGGGSYWFPAMVGAAAMGAAGIATYDHFQHHNGANDNTGNYADFDGTGNNDYDGDMVDDSGGDYELADF
jgi:hypothetical protein